MTQIQNHRFENIFLETDYENSNPRSCNIGVDDDGVFNLTQNFEKEAASGYSFHINTAFVNENPGPVLVPLRIHWGEKEYDFCREYMYIGYDSGMTWRMIAIPCESSVSEFKIVLPKGRHLLCYTPKFDNSDYRELIRKYEKEDFLKVENITETPEKRTVSCFKLGAEDGSKFIVTTRAHGYETAGAYCITGLLKDIKRNPVKYNEFLESFHLYLFPMINPDAVYAGNCCVSTSGVNFGKELASEKAHEKDCAAKALTDFFLDLKPDFVLDMHNNTGPHLYDSFRSPDKDFLERFKLLAPDASRHQKAWNIYQKEWDDDRPMVKCHEEFGTTYMVTEFPWYTRLPKEMEEFGVDFFNAMFKLLMEN
jgi:hypothetical protein